jgi:phosphate/sulfate permease
LLSRLEKAGFTLSSAAPLLKKADELDALGVLEASSDKVLPLVATAIELAPSLLPLAATLLKTPPSTLLVGALASAGAAAGIVLAVPDDSVTNIAIQTLAVVPLGLILPGALTIGSVVLGKLSK